MRYIHSKAVTLLIFAIIMMALCDLSEASLVGAWKFQDGTASTIAADTSKYSTEAANGTCLNEAAIVNDGTRGLVLRTDGVNDKLDCGNHTKLDVTGPFTIMAWIKSDLNQSKTFAANSTCYMLLTNNTGAKFYVGPTSATATTGTITAGTWHHVAGTYTGTAIKLYIDGVLVATTAKTDSVPTTTNPFTIGGYIQNGTWSKPFAGYIDEVGVWNESLPIGAIDGSQDGTINYYRVNGISPKSIAGDIDYSGAVDSDDLRIFSEYWLDDCAVVDCNGANMNANNQIVDFDDYSTLAGNWMKLYKGGPIATVSKNMNVTTFNIDGQWLLKPGYSNYYPNSTYIAAFTQAGTTVFDFPSTATEWPGTAYCWTGPDTWNYTSLDSYFNYALTENPHALILPRIYIFEPAWWLADPANDSEMEIMDDGVSQSKYYSQYNTNHGILPRSGPFPSLASAKWRQDIAKALVHYIDHLKAQGYMDHLIGIEISGLATEEWYHWSSNRAELAGYSVPTRDAFRNWLRTRYNNDVNVLRDAWNNPTVTFDTVVVPTRAERLNRCNSYTFRDVTTKMNVVDFYQFYNELIPDTIDYFAKVIKEQTANTKLVGAFYAYMYEFNASPEFGHNALKRFLESKYLDYTYVTSSYQNRGLGKADLLRAPAYSALLHDKIWVPSNDTATIKTKPIFDGFVAAGTWDQTTANNTLIYLGYTDTLQKNQWMLRRSAGFNTCNGFYQMTLDLHGGYYNDTGLMAEVAYLNQFYDRTKNYDRSSNSQVLIVTDEYSCNFVSALDWNYGLLKVSLPDSQLPIMQMGAPTDHILIDDLALIDANRYKLVLFLNCYNMTNSQRTLVENLKNNNRTLVFCYAPGYFNGRNFSPANMKAVTGISMIVSGVETLVVPRVTVTQEHPLGQAMYAKGVRTFGPTSNSCKRIVVSDTNSVKLGNYPESSSAVSMAIRDFGTWKSIYCVTATMTAQVYKELARYAGVHIYNEANDTLYANKSYVSIHPASAGSRTITFPQPVTIYDALTEGSPLATNVTTYTRSYQLGETMIYRYVTAP